MRHSFRRPIAMAAVAALTLAACGDDNGDDDQAAQQENGEEFDESDLEDMLGDEGMEDMDDPNEDVEDGVYRGSGVVLPVPEGWQLDPGAFQQGLIAAISEDQEQYFSAQAIRTEDIEAAGQEADLDAVVSGVLEQFEEDPEVDEEVELEGAERAHQLTFASLPAPQEGMPEQRATILFAEDGNGMFGQFEFAASVEAYDEEFESLLLAEAGFDPDSEPPEMPEQPGPEGGEMTPEEMEEMEEMFEQEAEDQ